jgi:putative membrane protein
MRRQITFGFFWAFLAVTLFGCNSDQANPNRNTPTMNTANSNAMNSNLRNSNATNTTSAVNANSNTAVVQDNFWSNAAAGGMAEVELGKLAAQKAQNPEVKRFAQMMVTDHTKANTELKTLATKKNVTLPTGLSSSHQSTLDKLNGLSGAEFDRAYVEAMVEDHEDTVDLMEDNADNSDADVKAFAAKTLPVVKGHLDMIKGIQAKLK